MRRAIASGAIPPTVLLLGLAWGALSGAGFCAEDEPAAAGAPAAGETSGVEPASDDAIRTVAERGPVRAELSLSPAAPRIGDELTVELTVTAEEGVEVLMPEFQDSLERFRVTSFAPRDRVDADGRTIKVHTYTIEAPLSGNYSIPPILVEFLDRRPGRKLHPDGEPAFELLTERLDFEIETVLPEDARGELRPALGELPPLAPPAPPVWPWFAGGLAALAVASPFLLRAWAHYRRLARRRSAFDIACTRLDRLLARGTPQGEAAIDRFFVELSGIARRYLEDRFELRAPELTTEEFLAEVAEADVLTADHQHLLRDFLRGADLVKFAHALPEASQIEDSVASVRRFLEETRENAPLLEMEEESTAAHDVVTTGGEAAGA